MHQDACRTASPTAEPERSLPTSSVQARLWARHHVDPAGRNNLAAAVRLRGDLDLQRLLRGLEILTRRHPLLRTRFPLVNDQPRQWIARTAGHELLLIDARDVPGEQALRRATAALRQPFDLEAGPLWRSILLRAAPEEWRLSLSIHPLLADRRTLDLLLRDLFQLYRDGGGDTPLAIQGALAGEGETPVRALSYWRDQLQGWAPLELSGDQPRSAHPNSRGGRHPLALPDGSSEALQLLARQSDLPLDAVLLSSFAILLARYSGQSDIAVAAQFTQRDQHGPDATGPLSSLLPIRAEVAGAASGLECVRRVGDALSAARSHMCPYEDLVEAFGLPAVPATMFAFDERPAIPALPELEVELADVDLGTAPASLSLHLFRDGSRVSGYFEYDSGVFSAATMARMGDHFLRLTRSLGDHPDRPIALLPMVSAEERDELRARARGTAAEAAPDVAIHTLFEAQVDRTPDAIAVAWEGGTWTYRELDRRANQLARHLVGLGVGAETLVCIHADRSPEMIAAIWGVLKAGGAYVPLDAAYPRERLAHILERTGASVILTQAALLPAVPDAKLRAVCLDTDWPLIAEQPDERPGRVVEPEQLAYVIFTSGSTGKPKGVMIEHRSLVHYTRAVAGDYRIAATDRVLQFASISFDASVEEIATTLTSGATLTLRRSPTLESVPHFLARCAEQQITVLSLPTAYWHELVAALAHGEVGLPGSLRLVIIGGEQASAPALADWKRHVGSRVQLLNTYGPTEATVVTTVWDAASATPDLASVPIGRPLPGSTAYVLDSHLEPLPVGVAGELYIGGPGVARGYLGDPDLTADRFTRDPFADDAAARLYRTGDRCRLHESGELLFLGRGDHQLKLNGHRIELEEIEAHLRAHPGVVDATVIARADQQGGICMVGYVAAAEPASLSLHELRNHLERWLVPHLIPTLVVLDRLPRTVSGKIDRSALPEPSERSSSSPLDAARHPVEELVQQLFCEALDGKPVGIHDDFFALGGDSLAALELVTLIEVRLHLELPVQVLYDHPTVESLTQALLSDVHGDSALVTCDELAAEARLDASIRVPPGAPAPSPPGAAFVTGATGFLGAFVLADLLAETRATTYCLVRARSVDEAKSRLSASWARFFGTAELPADRVIAVPGDISEPGLGLSEPAFRQLAEQVDVIYHSAAAVNYLLPYRSLRVPNVHGTEEVMRLATSERLKPLHHVSTLGVFGAADRVADEASPLDLARELGDGYSQSKWVAEKLCEQARAIGLPVTIYRPGRLTGHSLTGASNARDFLLSLLQACVELGAAPDLDFEVDMVPVDFASAALVRLSLRPDSAGRVFHLGHPQPIEWRQLVAALTSFGYPLRRLSVEAWSVAAKQLATRRKGSRLRLLTECDRDQLREALAAGYDCSATLAALAAAGGARPPAIDEPLLRAGFGFLVRTGLLPRPKRAA